MSNSMTFFEVVNLCIFILSVVNGTIDINVSVLRHLADHLNKDECRKLLAAAHFANFELPNALSEAKLRISKDLSCYELLLHWNSSPGEGKGRTHEILEHRLRQLGKNELADWLGKTVFQEIGKDLQEAVQDEFKSLLNETTTDVNLLSELPTVKYEEPVQWLPIDSILYAILVFLILSLIAVCCKFIFMFIRGKATSKEPFRYSKMNFSESSDSESEVKFDFRMATN